MTRRCLIVCLVLGVAATLAAAQRGTGNLSENFDAGQLQGWELVGGAKVANMGQGKALVITSEGFGFWEAAQVGNFTMQVSVMPPQEGVAQINFRMGGEPPQHGEYQLRFDEGRNVSLVRMSNDQEKALASSEVNLSSGQWVKVQISANGGQIQVSVGGQQLLNANDPQPLAAGAVGFGGFGQQIAYDNITISGAAVAGGTGAMQTISLPVGDGQQTGGGGDQGGGGQMGQGGVPGNPGSGMFAYIRIGDVQGDCKAANFQGWIEVQHYEFSIQNQAMTQVSRLQPVVMPLAFTKLVGRSSPILRQAACNGNVYQQVEMVVRFTGSVMRHILKNVTVASIDGAVLEQGLAVETLVLRAESVKWELRQLNQQGQPGALITGGWNLKTNTPMN